MANAWDPWAAPTPAAPPRRDKPVVALATAIVVLLVAGVSSVALRLGAEAADESRAKKAQERAAETAFDEALEGTPDTASVSPDPDGTKRYGSPAPDSNKHAFHLTLPPGWEGSYVGTRKNDYHFSDSVLIGPPGGVVIGRIDLGVGENSAEVGRIMIDGLTHSDPPMHLTKPWSQTSVGDDEEAFYVEGTITDDGDDITLRVVVFHHGNETFRVDLAAATPRWTRALPDFDRILASWRWG